MTHIRSYPNGHRGQFTTASGGFYDALQDAVRDYPIPAALIGMGVLWMFMGGGNTSLFGGGGRKSIFGTASRGAEQMGGVIRDTAAKVGSSLGSATNAAADTAAQATGGVREASARTAGRAADALAAAYDTTAETASRATGTISNATTSAAHSVEETGRKWGNTVHQSIADLFERQPLLLGAVGIALGAGIAASIPATEAERQVMGDASRFVREAVTEKSDQIKEMADAALGEAKAQGLTPSAAGEALRTIGEKVSTAGQAPTSAGPLTERSAGTQ